PADSLRGADAVVHLAGEPVAQRWTPETKRRIRTSRVDGTRTLVEAISKLSERPAVLVAASAIGYYGSRGDEELSEEAPPGEGFLPEICQAWEKETDAAAQLGVRVVKLRVGVVLGLGGGALAQMLTPFRLGLGGRLGSGEQWMSWIHLDDVVGLVRHAIEQSKLEGAVNATAPNPVSNADFTRTLARVLRRPAFFPVPERAIRILFGEMSEILTASQRVVPKAAEAAGFKFSFPDLGTALKNLLS
ncbi:MAG: TIGR01777 family protein, partial [bacterium]|nr:TIGR01777 family protein [bacterium]